MGLNDDLLKTLRPSFEAYLSTTANGTKKLEYLHGFIANTLQNLLGTQYKVISKGIGNNSEEKILGRYMYKTVDITIKKNNKSIAGVAVKFAMSNYKQNSNNYFEGMLGETANLRANNIPYYQVFIIADHIPYYKDGGNIKTWEEISLNELSKYIVLSKDNTAQFFHTSDKIFIGIVHIEPQCPSNVTKKSDYIDFYTNHKPTFTYSKSLALNFGQNVIYNDFETFINKVVHHIKSL